MMKTLAVETVESYVAVRNIKAQAEVPVVKKQEVCVAYVLKQGVTSAVGEQENGSVKLGVKEIFAMPEQFSFSEHKLTGETHLYASFDMAVLMTDPHTDGKALLETDGILASGHSKIVYPEGSPQAFARLSLGEATEEDIQLLRTPLAASFCAHKVFAIKLATPEFMDRLIKSGDVPKDFKETQNGDAIVSHVSGDIHEMMEKIVEITADEGMDEVATAFMDYFINNPEMIREYDEPERSVDRLKVGRQKALDRLLDNAKEHKVMVHPHAEMIINDIFDELVSKAEEDPAEDLRKMTELAFQMFAEDTPEEVQRRQLDDVDIYSKLMKLNYAKLQTSQYGLPKLVEKIEKLEETLAKLLSENGKELYDTKVKAELARINETNENEEDSFESFMKEMNEMFKGADAFDTADLTERQSSQLLEEHPEVKQVIENIMKQQGKTFEDAQIDAQIMKPKKDNE